MIEVGKKKITDPHQLHQGVVYPRSVWQEEATSRAQVIEEKKLLLFADLAMITLGSFSKEQLVFRQFFFVREGDSIDTLQRLVVRVAKEIRRRVLGNRRKEKI